MHYYNHHFGDYDSATQHLSLLEHGIYLRLMHLYYRREGNFPEDDAAIFRLIRAIKRPEKEAAGRILDEFFPRRVTGVRTNGRCDEEIARMKGISEKRAVAAVKSNNQKKTIIESQNEIQYFTASNSMKSKNPTESNTGASNCSANAEQLLCNPISSNQYPITNNQNKLKDIDCGKGGVGGKPFAPCGASPPDGGAQNHPDDLFDGDCGASKIDAMPENIAPVGVWLGSIGNDTSCQPIPASGEKNGHKIDSGRKQRKASDKRRSRIDPEWEITVDDKNYVHAEKCGMTLNDIVEQEANFKNHHTANGTLMADWDAAWRTWCGRWKQFR